MERIFDIFPIVAIAAVLHVAYKYLFALSLDIPFLLNIPFLHPCQMAT